MHKMVKTGSFSYFWHSYFYYPRVCTLLPSALGWHFWWHACVDARRGKRVPE